MAYPKCLRAACVYFIASLTALAAPACAADQASATGTYKITFLGIPFGKTRYEGTFDAHSYAATSHFKTSGLVSVFWEAEIDATVKGTYDAERISPASYDSYYRSGHKRQRVALSWNEGKSELLAEPPYNITNYTVTDDQKKDAVDPMSALTLILLGLTSDKTNPCGTVAPVFDGKRRYNIELAYLRDKKFKLGNKLFDGTAHLCQIRYTQIAGYKQKILDEGKKFPPIYGYFEDLPSAVAPDGHYVVALKIWADTDWGTLAITLAERGLKEAPRTN